MAAKVVRRSGGKIVVEVEIDLADSSMLGKEASIREAVNEVGVVATADALAAFDTDGKPIASDGVKLTSKGRHTEEYESPYGRVTVPRHVYQSASGGRTFCPLESKARMILNSTPAHAKTLSYKYAHAGARAVADDLREASGREISPAYVRMVGDLVGDVAAAKEEDWEYSLPEAALRAACISVGLDGACMLLVESGWRVAMTGAISFHDADGGRIHTIYMGATPEYGKEKFLARLDRELAKAKAALPGREVIGLADGAADNWSFLAPRVDRLVLDFFHAGEYVKLAAGALVPGLRRGKERDAWVEDRMHRLKHKRGAAKRLLKEMSGNLESIPEKHKEPLRKAVTYFQNHHHKMDYAAQTKDNMPIGSGVTEAACKTLIKQRLCGSGMRWKEVGAAAVIATRSLALTKERWQQFWERISENGCPNHREFTKI